MLLFARMLCPLYGILQPSVSFSSVAARLLHRNAEMWTSFWRFHYPYYYLAFAAFFAPAVAAAAVVVVVWKRAPYAKAKLFFGGTHRLFFGRDPRSYCSGKVIYGVYISLYDRTRGVSLHSSKTWPRETTLNPTKWPTTLLKRGLPYHASAFEQGVS